jgi:uncharacterized protein YerC
LFLSFPFFPGGKPAGDSLYFILPPAGENVKRERKSLEKFQNLSECFDFSSDIFTRFSDTKLKETMMKVGETYAQIFPADGGCAGVDSIGSLFRCILF